MQDKSVFEYVTTRAIQTTNGFSQSSKLDMDVWGDPLSGLFSPGVVRASVRVLANNPDDLDDSYCWQLESVYDWGKPKEDWTARNNFDQIGATNVTLISGPATPVCEASFKQGVGNNDLYLEYRGETGKTYDWHWEIRLTMFCSIKEGRGYPPRLTVQISSGMEPAESWCGMTEGIHTVVPSGYEINNYSPLYSTYRKNKEHFSIYDTTNTSYLYLDAIARYATSANYTYSSKFQFYWGMRSTSTAVTTTTASSGAPPTGINGLLRDTMLDRTVVIGSGPTEVTFQWERFSGDPAGLWGNY